MSIRERKSATAPESLPLPLPEDVGAIAVDTNVYKEYGFRTRGQPLAELPNVKNLGIKWLVPEFWELELLRHMTLNAEKLNILRRDLENAVEWASKEQLEHADKLLAAVTLETKKSVASRLLTEHYRDNKPVRLRTVWSAGPGVIADYFTHRDPFEASGAKRKEFPDAFALATLTDWAKKNCTKVLVVTNDAGCLRACAASEYLVGSGNLTEALGALRTADAGRKEVIEQYEKLLSSELVNEVSDLRRGIDLEIEKRLMDLELDVDYQSDSGHECEYELSGIKIERIDPVVRADKGLELRVFTATVGELSFSCEFSVRVEAMARFARAFRGTRSTQLHGAPEHETNGTIDLEAIVTLQPIGSLSAQTLPHANIRKIELLVRNTDIDFGEVEAWEPDYEE